MPRPTHPYIPTWSGFLYLAMVLDVYSRRIVGWSMETHLRTELILAALNMAITQRQPSAVIHHSDRGCRTIHKLRVRQALPGGRRHALDGIGGRCVRQRDGGKLLCHARARTLFVCTLGGNVRPTARFYELEHAAISLLTHANPRILIIDEIQHLLSCSAREQRAALNMVKFLSNDRRISVVAAGTHEAPHVMRFDPQIASRFEQMELLVWTESDELRRFVAGYLAMLPIRKNSAAVDQRFIEYVLALTDGVTGRIIDLLRRAAVDALGHKSKSVGIDQLLIAGAHLPAIINQRGEFPI